MSEDRFMTLGDGAKGAALGVGSNLAVLYLVDEITADIQWVPGVGRAGVVAIVVLCVAAGYVLIRKRTALFRRARQQASLGLCLCFALAALLTLLGYFALHAKYVIEVGPIPAPEGVIYERYGLPAPEGFVQPPPFVRPLWIPGPRESGPGLTGKISLHEYLARFDDRGGWPEAVEYDRRFLDERLAEYPLARVATSVVFVGLYVMLVSWVTASTAFALREPTRQTSEGADDKSASIGDSQAEQLPEVVVKARHARRRPLASAEALPDHGQPPTEPED